MPFSWTKEVKRSFEKIKEALVTAPTLINPNYDRYFILYAFGGVDTISAMLCQQNEGLEQPMALFSQVLHNHEVKYSFIEKHVFVVVRSLKKFRHMLSNNRIQLLVAHSTVKDFLLNQDINDKCVGWITKVMEFDIDIKVAKLVRGKGLCEQLAENEDSSLKEVEDVDAVLNNDDTVVVSVPTATWVQQMIHYL